jgi:hypothetical protein
MFGKLAFVKLCGFFLEFLTLILWGDRNFLNSILFLTIFSVLDAPIRRVQDLFGHQKQESPPLKSSLP